MERERGWGRLLDSVRVLAPWLMICWEAGSALKAEKGGRDIAFQDMTKLTMYKQIIAFRTEKTGLEPISSASMYID